MASVKIITLNHDDAKKYFLDEKNYVNFDIPEYFHFNNLLKETYNLLSNKDISTYYKKNPKNYENVNYTFLSNKDGSFAWRPFRLIHPALYVDLVNKITDESNWNYVVDRFKDFKQSNVECISIPRVSQDESSHKASQVKHWWEEMEQKSIKMALKYDYIFATDITNCYGSIYTHSIEWALAKGGKQEVKNNREAGVNVTNILGNEIDTKIRNMNCGQTNGIPQGSTLMDFIAEIILGYADLELNNKISSSQPSISKDDYQILRYRDDYRIFVNDPVLGHQILKNLNDVLYELGMKMNANKTIENGDVILSSIKKEKAENTFISPVRQHYQKETLRIYQLSKKYPNSGLVVTELCSFYDDIEKRKKLYHVDIIAIISILTMTALTSPKTINWVAAIISILLKKLTDQTYKKKIVERIHLKFKKIPNTSLIDVWLQRIAAPLNIKINYNDPITKVSLCELDNSNIWNSCWLNDAISLKINAIEISDLKNKIDKKTISTAISRSEVELFKLNYFN